MKRRNEAGSVSVYFIAITAAFVLLTALLIDFARIAAFRYHAELAVQSGVRSVLSSFDPVVYARYGLFIRGGEDAGEMMRTAASGHFSQASQAGTFSYLDAEWTAIDVTESRPLADHGVFRRQVLEEMKYKAPIDLALEFAGRFRGVSPVMKEAAATVGMLEKMRQTYERREAALDEVLASQQNGGDRIVSLLRQLAPYPAFSVNGSLPAGKVGHAAEAALRYDDYVTQRKVDKHQRAVTDFESGLTSLSVSLADASGRARSRAEDAYSSALQAWRRAQEANEEMKAIAREAASLPSGGRTNGDVGLSSEGEVDWDKVNSVAELRKTSEQLLLDASFFETYASELSSQRSSGLTVAEEAGRFSSVASSAVGVDGMGSALRDGANRLQSALAEYADRYAAGGAVVRDRKVTLQAHRSGDEQRQAEERNARAEWSGLAGFLGALSGRTGSEEDRASFAKADKLFHDNLTWNRAEAVQTESSLPGEPSQGRDRAMSHTDGMLDALQGSLSGLGEQLYFSEYTMQRFSHFPPSEAKRMLDGGEVPLPLTAQQAEYVLYGLNNPARNIAAAYGEIASMRLAIRTMEGLVECRSLGHPLVVLAAALVYGIRNAVLDMRRLLEQDSVPLSKYVKVDTTYADYLRLFLLLHGGSAGHLARSIAVMETETGVSFSKAYTYASGEGTASVRLWFFPGLLKVLGRAGQLGGTVKGNRYEASYTADSSYQ